ncbi:MAG: hypothetical protein U9R75_11740, partial [Candidatus Thermoplasmatota archaeon]|nr:hypothetical protein [Candidatus Thermoplasmatota archaeon]
VSGTVSIEWSSYDEEDPDEDLTYSIYYMHSSDTNWRELVTNMPNTGSYDMDTTEFDDGVYTIKVVLMDTRDEPSPSSSVYFTIYNPDAPEVISATGPTATVDTGKAKFTWFAEDDDPGETDLLMIWFYISSDGTNWESVAEGLPNLGTYTMDVSTLDDGSYNVKMIIADCQEGEFNMTVEHLFPTLIVDNNDPPTIEITQGPDPTVEYDESVSVSWGASDPEDDELLYSVYYRKSGTETWIPANNGLDLTSTTFSIDTSTLDDGVYEMRIVAKEDERGGFESEVLAQSFTIKHVSAVIDDDDDDTIGDDDDGETKDSGMMLVAVFGAIALLMVIGLIAVGLVIMKKKQAEAQIPPPGGFPGQIPGPNTAQLPGQDVTQGQLPQQQVSQLPPAPAPETQAPQTPAPLETPAVPALETQPPASVPDAPAPETAAPEQTVEVSAPQDPPPTQ